MTHTPGPWRSHDVGDDADPDCGLWVVDLPDDAEVTVTRLYFGDMETNTGRDIANANLVAAAPDLLEALIAVMRDLTDSGEVSETTAVNAFAAVGRATDQERRDV